MKNLRIIILAIAVLSMGSCEKDDKKDSTPAGGGATSGSYLKVDGKTYGLKTGIAFKYGDWDGPGPEKFNHALSFVSTVVQDDQFGFPYPVDSIYSRLNLQLYSSDSINPSIGTYTYAWSGDAFTFDEVTYEINIDMDNDSSYVDMENGIVKILQNGSTYEVTYNGTNDAGKVVSLYYKGVVRKYDFSGSNLVAPKISFFNEARLKD